MKDLAPRLGVEPKTLSSWKRDDDFLAEWEKLYRRTIGSPEKMRQVTDALHETARDRTDPRQVQAARAYADIVDAAKPKKIDVNVNQTQARDLSDDTLLAILAERAAVELEQRKPTDA